MKPIRQESYCDCFNSCLASITGIPKEEIPLFIKSPGGYIQTARKWLAKNGFVLSEIKDFNSLDGRVNSIVAVDPFMFDGVYAAHAVVARRGRVVHDPARRRLKKRYDIVCGWEVRRTDGRKWRCKIR